ncbi:MAG: porin [Planctomycetota bacterium]|nr:porin [Planctomycetota bacterium]
MERPAPRGFFIADPVDPDVKLKISGVIQFRYVANLRDDDVGSDDETTTGFQARRTWLIFSGDVGPKLSFMIQSEFLRTTGDLYLLDAWAKYKLAEGLSLRAGQFKLPLLREETIPNTMMLAVENSITNDVFTQSRSQGIELTHEGEQFRVYGAFSDGLKTINTDYDAANEADYALTARAEWLAAGAWSSFRDFTSFRGSEGGTLLGGAVHWQQSGRTGDNVSGNAADVDLLQYTLDATVKGDGWNLFAAFIGRNTDDARATSSFDDFGLVAQGGVFLAEQSEVFARYDVIFPDSDRPDAGPTGSGAGGDDPFSTITAGFNYYLSPRSHAAKFTADVQYSLDAQADSSSIVRPNTGVSLLRDPSDGQTSLRVQFQLLF